MTLFKDETLDALAHRGNVAQFVSFRPNTSKLSQTFSRIQGFSPNHKFATAEAAVDALLRASADRCVNVRSYVPDSPRSKEFVYGLRSREEVMSTLQRLAISDLHLIVNETIDVADGGVSGVIQGDVVEFAPDDTPRCVEKPGVASLPFPLCMLLFEIVYGFKPELESRPSVRTEFSIHPAACGYKKTRTLLWEQETDVPGNPRPSFSWPNRFSKFVGDKAFGLLIAHLLGAKVPRTLVIGRRLAPFSFGEETGSGIVWTRTCPTEPQPGLYTTARGWIDPFALVAKEDKTGTSLASVLCQSGVPASYSGAGVVGSQGTFLIEGRHGQGDRFMLGLEGPELLPLPVITDVERNYDVLSSRLGAVRFEWVHDGKQAWIVQLHKGATTTDSDLIVPGDPVKWVKFNVADGLESLRTILNVLPDETGIIIEGQIGVTSHVADLLRKAKRPARIQQRSLL